MNGKNPVLSVINIFSSLFETVLMIEEKINRFDLLTFIEQEFVKITS
jgi:hypothetical protein